MKRKLIQCPKCGKGTLTWIEENGFSDTDLKKLEGALKILKSQKGIYEKKIALFNWLKKLEVGEPQSDKEQRANYLLQSRWFHELAKQSMQDYKKVTAKEFGKDG